MYKTDTIAAIATPLSNSGIGIIRVSGTEAIEKVDLLFRGKIKLKNAESHTIHYGHIYDGEEVIDEVMVLLFKAPRSYTTEDSVEIDCHGGVYILKKILSLLLETGVRLAEPGEFTKRAFLNGRIDLSQAESVMDLIDSKSSMAAKNSMRQLQGKLSNQIKSMRKDIIYEIAYIESALDDPEHISLDGYSEKLSKKLDSILTELGRLTSSFKNGSIIKNGICTTIIGKPNVGKSSLLNMLAKRDRAIVTDIAGTTRDTLEETISLGDVVLRIIDTAGIRDTDDFVEQIGVSKAVDTIDEADLILYVVDSSVPLDENDSFIMEKISDKKVIVLLNKSDLATVVTEEEIQSHIDCLILPFSAVTGEGLEELEKMIEKLFFEGSITENDDLYITNIRHMECLKEAEKSLLNVADSISKNMPEDFLSIDLMDAYESLGTLIGESVEDDLANEIFSKFCMGK